MLGGRRGKVLEHKGDRAVVQRPILGLKFAVCELFSGQYHCNDIFRAKYFAREFFWGLKTSLTGRGVACIFR